MRATVNMALTTVCLGLVFAGCDGCDSGSANKPAGTGKSTLEPNVAKDFQLPQYDKQNRLQSMVFGEKAKFITNSPLVEITIGRLEVYDQAGATNMIIDTPFCVVNKVTKNVTSTEHIYIRTPDGRMVTEGIGFSYENTNQLFTITNQVKSGFAESTLKSQ